MWSHLFDLGSPLIGPDNTWGLWTVCVLGATLTICLEQRYRLAAKMTGALIALVIAMLLSSLRVIPMESPVWDSVWTFVAPLSLPLVLLGCDVRQMGREAGQILKCFLVGSVGTALGTMIGFLLLKDRIPELEKLVGVFTATYTGGAINFDAVGRALDVSREVLSAATVADNMVMALVFAILMIIPSMGFFRRHFHHPFIDDNEADAGAEESRGTRPYIPAYSRRSQIALKDIALSLSVALVIVGVSRLLGGWCGDLLPQGNTLVRIVHILFSNEYTWISAISISCATLKPGIFGAIHGAREIGVFLIYIYFFTLGVPASIPLLLSGSVMLLVFALVVVITNMLCCFLFGRIFRCPLEDIILAVNACIGGPTTAAAMAGAKGWNSLAGPAILVGVLGYALGSYLGLMAGGFLCA
ncbi:DUF819 domain-containing protein [Eubacterium sp. AB3007]|uniref:DUF819 family protein n=1 Tax=Eubacterium sp. AB3007 TaxID=1392487 RepID=UPI00054F3605|nr:DUF819 family protein [Eubacterium sp. AB3007]